MLQTYRQTYRHTTITLHHVPMAPAQVRANLNLHVGRYTVLWVDNLTTGDKGHIQQRPTMK